MTQTIRDVLIKIALQTDGSKFTVPDFKDIEARANAATAAVDRMNAAFKGAAQAAKSGAAGGSKGSSFFGDMDLGTSRYQDQIVRQRRFQEQILAGDEKTLSRGNTLAKYYESARRSNDDYARSQRAALEIENQRAEATMLLANAGMKLARGVAFVTAANEQEYQSMLKLIATAQGYFDIFSGIIDGYKSYLNFSKIATATKLAEAAATTTLANAESGLSVARMGGMGSRALGVAGRAGGALAIAAGVGMAGRFLIRDAYGLGVREQHDAAYQARINAYNSDEARLARDQAGTSRMQQFGGMIESRLGAGQSMRSALQSRRGGYGTIDSLNAIERDRAISTQMLQTADYKGSVDQIEVEKAERRKKVLDINLAAEKERQSVLQKEAESLQRQLDISLGIKQAAVETLRAEESRYQSMESRIGRLSAGEASRLKSISEKVQKGGQLSRSEAEFLDRTGIGTSQSEAYFRQEGQRRGSAGILSGLREDRGLNIARENFDDSVSGEVGRAAEFQKQELEKVSVAIDKSYEEQARFYKRLIEASERLAEEQAKMEQRLSKVENGNFTANTPYYGTF